MAGFWVHEPRLMSGLRVLRYSFMPIREPVCFADVDCPDDVFIATNDTDGCQWNPAHRWV